MTLPIERLQNALTTLGPKALEARLEGLLEQAAKKEPTYAESLDELLGCEVETRRTRYCGPVCSWRICRLSKTSINSSSDFSRPSMSGRFANCGPCAS